MDLCLDWQKKMPAVIGPGRHLMNLGVCTDLSQADTGRAAKSQVA